MDFKPCYENLPKYLTEVSQNLKVPSFAGKLLPFFLVAFTRTSHLPNLKNKLKCELKYYLLIDFQKLFLWCSIIFNLTLQVILQLDSTVIGISTEANCINRQVMVFIIVVTKSL